MRRLFTVLTLLLLALLSACTGSSGVPEPTPMTVSHPTPGAPLTLTVVHTNDTWGYLAPCG